MKLYAALAAVVEDKDSMRLPHWPTDTYIKVQWPDKDSQMTEPYLYLYSQGLTTPWLPNQGEVFTELWEVHVDAIE